MVHAPKLKDRIADAGGDAGPQRRHQHLVRPLRNLMLAKQHFDRVSAEAGMEISFAALFRMVLMAVTIVMAGGWLHGTAW
jgi:hypothetical protein